jgi:DNA polymerase III alpha subunit
MRPNKFGEIILSELDVMKGLYSGSISELSELKIDREDLVTQFKNACKINADRFPLPTIDNSPDISTAEFDRNCQANWFMPEEYFNFDINEFLKSKCESDAELERVELELELFSKHNMTPVLKYLKYLVDTMRSNSILWGVGRGSSVASYCLYLLGVHRINSILYDLDIHEFLK